MSMVGEQPDGTQIRQQLDRIAKSSALAGAVRLQELLAYTVEETLAGRGSELKETVIGQEVFARSGHDPRLDSIVRVTISKLRAKLREYYLTEGINDPVEIHFPRGGYAPVLRLRSTAQPHLEEDDAAPIPLPAPTKSFDSRWLMLVGILALCVTALGVAIINRQSRQPRQLELVRFQVPPPQSVMLRKFPQGRVLVSPDGKKLAVLATEGDSSRILVRPLESLSGSLLAVPPVATLLAWSPDSRSIAFYSDGQLWRIDAAGGSPLSIGEAKDIRSAAWASSGQIIYANGGSGALLAVPIKGGKATSLTVLSSDNGEIQHTHPVALPGGEELLYTSVRADPSQSTIYQISLHEPSRRTALVKANSNAGFLALPDGRTYLLYIRGDSLVAHPFDPKLRSVSGEPFILEPKASYYPFHSMADFSASNGVVAYRAGTVTEARKLILLDRAGRTRLDYPSTGIDRFPRISPDGRSLAVERMSLNSAVGNLWVAPLENLAAANRVTLDPAGAYSPVWLPDSQSLIYGTRRASRPGVIRQSLRDGTEQQVARLPGTPTDCSPDGQWVIFNQEGSETFHDIWLARTDGLSPPIVFRQTRHDEVDAQFSPDGQWVAYCSKESGVWDVYVERFLPKDSERARIHVSRGFSPLWTKGGKELVFFHNGFPHAAQRQPGEGVKFSEPKQLFSTKVPYHRGFGYHVSPDGEKFVFSVPSGNPSGAGETDMGVLLWK